MSFLDNVDNLDEEYEDQINAANHFFFLINKDGLIEINNRLYFFDFKNDRIAIMPKSDEKFINLLLSAKEIDGLIYVEPLSSEIVFDINPENASELRKENLNQKKCKEKKAKYTRVVDVTNGYLYKSIARRFKVTARYMSLGLYFELSIKVEHEFFNGNSPINSWQLSEPVSKLFFISEYQWKVKCKDVYGSSSLSEFFKKEDNVHVHPYYHGLKPLTSFKLRSNSGGVGLDGVSYFLSKPIEIGD